MTELTDFTDPTPDLTRFEEDNLRLAGASPELIEMCNVEIDDLQRDDGKSVTRNSVLEEVKKYTREWEKLDEDSAPDFTHYSGGFFTEIWNGNLYSAYCSADRNNKEIMKKAFGVRRINKDRPSHVPRITA